jgi:FkbM family methyltransferase
LSIKTRLVRAVPTRFQTPWRYHLRRLSHRLERELAYLGQILDAPSTCVDVGANFGMYTYALAKLARRVEAFEPLPACADALEAYFGENVHVHRVALSSRQGRVNLYTPVEGGRPNVERSGLARADADVVAIEVDAKSLDDFEFEEVSFLKVDVEGHELDVLAGATDTIARSRPVMLLEIEQRHISGSVADVIARVEGYGYRGHFLSNGVLREASAFVYEVHQAPFLDGVLAPGYVNNFFFLPA